MPADRNSERTNGRETPTRADQARYLSLLGRWARDEISIDQLPLGVGNEGVPENCGK